jgi:hypothetical protein
MVVGESDFRHQVEDDIRPFRDVLLGLFFFTVGTEVDPSIVAAAPMAVLTWIVAFLPARKQRGEKIERPKERPPAEVINLMDALRQSAAGKRDVVHTHQRRSAGRRRTPLDRSTVRSRKAR